MKKTYFCSPEPQGELKVYPSSRRLCVCSHFQTKISPATSPTSELIATKLYLKHHWGGEKAAVGYGPDRFGTLVSMTTDSSHRVIMGENLVNTLAPSFFISWTSSNFGPVQTRTVESAARKRLKNRCIILLILF